ncbi:MAG: hypothetical protein WCT36_00010 [Candidatus Gracilibacteria bacterium]|jgi:hypothetical protein
MKKTEEPNFDPDRVAEDLIEAAGKGVVPSPEVLERLIAALKNPGAKAEAGGVVAGVAAISDATAGRADRAAEPQGNLRERVMSIYDGIEIWVAQAGGLSMML